MVDIRKYAKAITSQMSASTRKESAQSSSDGSSDRADSGEELEEPRQIKFKYGDKFTKKPIQMGKYLVFLGRIHIQLFDTETLETKILLSVGEDQAEKFGQLLKENPQMLKQKNKTEDDLKSKQSSLLGYIRKQVST